MDKGQHGYLTIVAQMLLLALTNLLSHEAQVGANRRMQLVFLALCLLLFDLGSVSEVAKSAASSSPAQVALPAWRGLRCLPWVASGVKVSLDDVAAP